MEISAVMRDLIFDFNKPSIDALLALISHFGLERTVKEFYDKYDIDIPYNDIDHALTTAKLDRLIYVCAINAEIAFG